MNNNKSVYYWLVTLLFSFIAWIFLYTHLNEFADYGLILLKIDKATHLGEAIHFFLFDTPKVILLLIAVVFLMGVIQTFFTPEKVRAILAGRRLGFGNIFAALFGIVTPFCSCSAVPLFIGFVSAGVPLGITFSFLISAPMVNEIALALLFSMFGWKIVILYLSLGLFIAIVSGLIIGQLNMNVYLEDWVQEIQNNATIEAYTSEEMGWVERFDAGLNHIKEIVVKVWLYIIAGIALGAGIHGYIPEDFMASFMGKEVWWSVPAAVLMGIPMYTNAAGVIPIVQALLGKGAALGTVLAFMMSVIGLSAPEMVILRNVLKPPLIAVFAGIVAVGILFVGYIFNAIL